LVVRRRPLLTLRAIAPQSLITIRDHFDAIGDPIPVAGTGWPILLLPAFRRAQPEGFPGSSIGGRHPRSADYRSSQLIVDLQLSREAKIRIAVVGDLD